MEGPGRRESKPAGLSMMKEGTGQEEPQTHFTHFTILQRNSPGGGNFQIWDQKIKIWKRDLSSLS